MIEALTAFGLILLLIISGGIALFVLYLVMIALFSDPDFKDEDDREIYEHNYWKKKKR